MKNLLKSILLFVILGLVSCSKVDLNEEVSSAATEASAKSQSVDRELSVMTYNTFHLPSIASGELFEEARRASLQLEFFRNMDKKPDVLVLTEAFNKDATTLINGLSNLGYTYKTDLVGLKTGGSPSGDNDFDSYTDKDRDNPANDPFRGIPVPFPNVINPSSTFFATNGGVIILSRYPIIEKHQLIFYNAHTSTFDRFSNKGAALVTIRKGEEFYNVVGTHLQADEGDVNGQEVRFAQIAEISRWVTHFNPRATAPIIYAGDMNIEFTNSSAITRLKRNLNVGLPLYSFNPSNDNGSYSTKNNKLASKKNTEAYNNTLDYILFRKNRKGDLLSAPKMEVISVKSNSPYAEGIRDLSDHHAVIVNFDFRILEDILSL